MLFASFEVFLSHLSHRGRVLFRYFVLKQVSTHPEFVEAEDIENKNARSYVLLLTPR